METINCIVDSILYPKKGQTTDNGFSIISCREKGTSKLFSAKGIMLGVRTDATAEITGSWKHDPKYGDTFIVTTYNEIMPQSIDGIVNYLSSGVVKGVGKKTAKLIVATFGEQTLDILNYDPTRLKEVPGIGEKKIDAIIASWEDQKQIQDIMLFLKTYNITNNVAGKIYKEYGKNSIKVMTDNPYVLADDIDGIGFKKADDIALSMGVGRKSNGRIRSAMLFLLNESSSKGGNTYYDINSLIKDLLDLLNENYVGDDIVKPIDVINVLSSAAKKTDIIMEGYYKDRIYLPKFWASEKGTATSLKRLSNSRTHQHTIDFEKLERSCNIRFEETQRDAIIKATSAPVCIITGGPGTGKTTTMRGVIAESVNRGQSVILLAPTGRAAKRLSETTGMEAMTIHRALGYKPGVGFEHNEHNQLRGNLLVIDESSMIDICLLNSLLKAVPSSMRVVFVGDIDQLPSISAGRVLKDMINSETIPVVRLTKIFRQAQDSLIVSNAHRINQGEMPAMPSDLLGGEDFCFISRPEDDTEAVVNDIVTLYTQYIPDMMNYSPKDIQVLTPQRKGILGTENLNKLLQDKLNPSSIGLKHGFVEFRVNDKVMQMKNNYDWDVFNGDVGRIIRIDREERKLTIDFNGKIVEADSSDLDNIDLAYATTVHKSQGSEYPVVITPIVTQHCHMLQRNLVYTALTRAKSLCVMIGSKRMMGAAIHSNIADKRNSALSERLNGIQTRSVDIGIPYSYMGPEINGCRRAVVETGNTTGQVLYNTETHGIVGNFVFSATANMTPEGWALVKERPNSSSRRPYNYINKRGELLSRTGLDKAAPFKNGTAEALINNSVVQINTAGEVISSRNPITDSMPEGRPRKPRS